MSYIADTNNDLLNTLNNQLKETNSYSLQKVRKEAISLFKELGLPEMKNEEYKYTHITKALGKEFDAIVPKTEPSVNENIAARFIDKDLEANILVFINGKLSPQFSKVISPESELVIREFSEAVQEFPEDIAAYFGKNTAKNHDAFTALNTAVSNTGAFIKVADNQIVEKPVVLYFISDTEAAKTVAHPRNLFIVGKNSQVSFVESFHSSGRNTSFTNIVSEISLNDHAFANYYKIQLEEENAFHVGNTQVYQSGRSTFNSVTVTLSGKMIRNNLNITLDGEGCESHMFGLYLLGNKQHVDNHTIVDHKKPHSESNELYKGILDGNATGVFNGKIYVRPGAQKTNAFQSNKNILLSDDATINTKPQLEIWADDVKCSHGATTGQIDSEQLFYLRTRGLSEDSARAMLLYAFAKDVLENIKIVPLKNNLDVIISERLHKDF